MITRNELKYYTSLLQKKFRNSENKFLAEGKKIVLEGLKSHCRIDKIFVTEKFLEKEKEYTKRLRSLKTEIIKVKSQDFRRISDTKSPEGIAAAFEIQKDKINLSSIKDSVIVYIEDISDPGNLGTIIRNCDWFGIKNVLLSKESAEVYNPKVIRASMGSIFHLNIFEDIGLNEILKLKETGYEFVCSDLSGINIFNFKKKKHTLLFLANESNGPSAQLRLITDKVVTIEGKGRAESLNVASASAVLLSELTK